MVFICIKLYVIRCNNDFSVWLRTVFNPADIYWFRSHIFKFKMFLKKLYIGAGIVLGYLILRFRSWDGSMLFYAFHANSNTGACRKYKQNLDYVPNN